MKKSIGAAIVLVVIMISAPALSQADSADVDRMRPMAPVSADHVAQHSRMTEQMRVMGADPRMVADPMWAAMQDASHIAAEEHMQEGLDRMLAR